MKKNKTNIQATLFLIASVGFYVAAILQFISGENRNMAIVWLCMGSSMLCLGSTKMNKKKKDDDE